MGDNGYVTLSHEEKVDVLRRAAGFHRTLTDVAIALHSATHYHS